MSNTIKERLMKLETQIEEHCKSNEENFNEIKKQLNAINENINGLDKRFSAKWVEKGIIIIITAIVLGALYTIFKNNGINLII